MESLSMQSHAHAVHGGVDYTQYLQSVASGFTNATVAQNVVLFTTTALHADAPPILAWDLESSRYPVSFYSYTNGGYPVNWKVKPGWATVKAIVNGWPEGRCPSNQVNKVMLVVEDCRDLLSQEEPQGNALFPETLLPALHSVRATIEAFSASAKIHGFGPENAAGLPVFDSPNSNGQRIKVITPALVTEYMIDRWD